MLKFLSGQHHALLELIEVPAVGLHVAAAKFSLNGLGVPHLFPLVQHYATHLISERHGVLWTRILYLSSIEL